MNTMVVKSDLREHSVDHDNHGSDQLEAPTEEQEVGPSARHNS